MWRMGRACRLTFAAVVLLGPALGCGWGGDEQRRSELDPSGFRGYADDVCRASGVDVRVERCLMVPGRRLGRCEVTGPGVAGLAGALGLTEADAETTEGWRSSHNSGCAEAGWTARHPGARLYLVPDEAPRLPDTDEGCQLHRVFVDDAVACFDLSYPWSS